MTIELWLKETIKKLESSSVPTAKLDAEVLLSDSLAKDRTWIHAHPDYILQRSDLRKLDEQIVRRMNHEPVAYIRGKQEFYGRNFLVSPDTLTPRPETETMIDLAISRVKNRELKVEDSKNIQIIDVGTGSGCIIITTALELSKISGLKPKASFLGLDISEPALKIAKKNAKDLKATVDFKKFDLISEGFNFQLSTFNLVLANLPYVPDNFQINLSATHEPRSAIFGGADGLDLYRAMFPKLNGSVNLVLTESLPPQHPELAKIAENAGFKLVKTQDLIQVFSSF